MLFSYEDLPGSLIDILDEVAYNYDIEIKDYMKIVKKNGSNVIFLDYRFKQNYHNWSDWINGDAKKIITDRTSELPTLLHKIGVHLFGDNVKIFYNIHKDNRNGSEWEILIENAICEDDWLGVDVYLIPKGIEIV